MLLRLLVTGTQDVGRLAKYSEYSASRSKKPWTPAKRPVATPKRGRVLCERQFCHFEVTYSAMTPSMAWRMLPVALDNDRAKLFDRVLLPSCG